MERETDQKVASYDRSITYCKLLNARIKWLDTKMPFIQSFRMGAGNCLDCIQHRIIFRSLSAQTRPYGIQQLASNEQDHP